MDADTATKTSIDIESLLHWVYQDQAAFAVAARAGRIGPAWYRTNAQGLAKFGRLGCHIDRSPGVAGDLHPDAEAVHDAVMALPREVAALVLIHAQGGTRPDAMAGERPYWEPIEGWAKDSGGVRVPAGYDYSYSYKKAKKPWFLRIRLINHPELITLCRLQYWQWWGALDALAGSLDLKVYAPLRPAAEASPW